MELKHPYRAWFGGLFFVVLGFGIFWDAPLSGLLSMGAGCFLIPPIRLWAYGKTNLEIPTGGRVTIIVFFLILMASAAPSKENGSSGGPSPAAQEQMARELRERYKARELQKQQETEQQRFAALPLEEKVKELAIKTWGQTEGRGYSKVIRVRKTLQTDGEDKGGYLIDIDFRAEGPHGMRLSILFDAMKMVQAMLETEYCSPIQIFKFNPYYTLVDKYVQTSEGQVGKISIRRATAQKINWDNISPEMFENLVREEQGFYMNPDIQ
jgi:hypothetical protein